MTRCWWTLFGDGPNLRGRAVAASVRYNGSLLRRVGLRGRRIQRSSRWRCGIIGVCDTIRWLLVHLGRWGLRHGLWCAICSRRAIRMI